MGSRGGAGGGGGGTARSRGEAQRALDEFEELAGLRGGGEGGGGGGGGGGERSTYVLEHLATFTVTRETGIVYPADGMRRLLQLEKTNGEHVPLPHTLHKNPAAHAICI